MTNASQRSRLRAPGIGPAWPIHACSGFTAARMFLGIEPTPPLKDATIGKLARPKQVLPGVSIDDIADMLEYTRYPVKWNEIEANLAQAIGLPNLVLSFNTAAQHEVIAGRTRTAAWR
jgi:hypothetical protein